MERIMSLLNRRRAGILLHPTSLPGPYGIGDIGPAAIHMLNWMQSAGLAYWQVLPLGPTGFGDSPYQCFSAFAGNPYLISPELLVQEGLLDPNQIEPQQFNPRHIDYGSVIPWKLRLLHQAHQAFREGRASQELQARYQAFLRREDIRFWLQDFALFMALKDDHGGAPWNTWSAPLRQCDPQATAQARIRLADSVAAHEFFQFIFFDQWQALRNEARSRGISIIGDAPIYVSYDSSDTWANQKLFQLDAEGNPLAVAGVPPDYFSETGQLWGNPLYDWATMAQDDFSWWARRIQAILALVDIVRLDHFRGFMGYWSVPAGAETAQGGRWIKGPGVTLFQALEKKLGQLPIIAEDLGEITLDVHQARKQLGYPGMAVMQFAWGAVSTQPFIINPNSSFAPHRHDPNTVVYSGTHDNDTTMGWWQESSTLAERTMMQLYLATDGNAPHLDLTRASFSSVANTAIIPAQDVIGAGSWARMNFPGRADGNWCWRLTHGELNADNARQIAHSLLLYERHASPPPVALPDPDKLPTY